MGRELRSEQEHEKMIPNKVERFITVKEAATLLGIKYHALRRAVNSGAIPSHFVPGNRRRLVLSSEIVAVVLACQSS